MRAYSRVTDQWGNKSWIVVQTDANGDNSYVHVVALEQCIKLNLNESPFWANFGIPAKSAVQQQLAPDYYMAKIAGYFSQFFPSLVLAKAPYNAADPTPVYNVAVMRNNGSIYQSKIGI